MKDLNINFLKGIYYGRYYGALTSEMCESAKIEGTVVIDNEVVDFAITLSIDTPQLRELYGSSRRLSKWVFMRNVNASVYDTRKVTEADEQELFRLILEARSKKNKTNEKLANIIAMYLEK